MVYNSLDANNLKMPNIESFSSAFEGYNLLKEQGKIVKTGRGLIDNQFLVISPESLIPSTQNNDSGLDTKQYF